MNGHRPRFTIDNQRWASGFTAALSLALTVALALASTATASTASTATPDSTLEPSIIAGSTATIADAPWQVALIRTGYNDFDGLFCGGSIISSWEILTAAHCVDSGGDVLTATDLGVMVGNAKLSTSGRTALTVTSITVHPNWNEATFQNDVAVLRLAAPITLTPGLQEAITLSSSTVADGTSALITGWGNTSTGVASYPDQLKMAVVTTVADVSCDTAYTGDGGIDAGTMLCAATPDFSSDTCQGDSGGPLAVRSAGRGYLAGVTSFGNGCAQSPYPGVYAEVSALAPWISAQLTNEPRVSRISGADRYSTAVAISRAAFPDPVSSVPVVFVSSGTTFPDALSAGPAAAQLGGALLLTDPSVLPAQVRVEIDRLNPDRIIVVGGTGSISAAVYSTLSDLAPVIARLGGADRYETSRKITAFAFSTTSTVFVADGAGFADALATGAAAGRYGAPVILVPGTKSAVDSTTLALLSSLEPSMIVAVGGTGVISAGVLTSLQTVAITERRAGSDRIATAIAVNRFAFDGTSEFVYLANAYSFPDALAGGGLATREAGPLFTVPTNCVPATVLAEISRLGATTVRLLGGSGVLTERVAALTSC